MKRIYLIFAVLIATIGLQANEPWKRHLISNEGVELHLDLYEESIVVPTLSDFGPMNGYLGGSIYGEWYVSSFTIKNDKQATIRLSNDLGSENQDVLIRQETDSTWVVQLKGYNAIRKVNGKKLEKVPDSYVMKEMYK